MNKNRPLSLSPEDWAEIYYALESKLAGPVVANDRRWRAHLEIIMETIGPDGEDAAACGVEAL